MKTEERMAIITRISETLIRAASVFPDDKYSCYNKAVSNEGNDLSAWAMRTIVLNADIARKKQSPLCDDTGIPHIIIEAGRNRTVSGEFLQAVYDGIAEGLRKLPGRPMAIKGSDGERISQSGGLDERPEAVAPAPVLMQLSEEDNRLQVTILLQGGGPEIRAKTYRVFHRHSTQVVLDEIIKWAKSSVAELGCSPCTIAIGIGRSHFEATAMMLQAMKEGRYDIQSEYEKQITNSVNEIGIGAVGLGGQHSVLATFMKVGPQRASGVRIVCMRPCCCFEPRIASVEF